MATRSDVVESVMEPILLVVHPPPVEAPPVEIVPQTTFPDPSVVRAWPPAQEVMGEIVRPEVKRPLAAVSPVAKRFVVVAFVVVLCIIVEPVTVSFPMVAFVATKLVLKALVVVAFVVVLRVARRSAKVCATVQVLAAVTVAKYPASADCARPFVKYKFDPSVTLVVRRPKDEVAI